MPSPDQSGAVLERAERFVRLHDGPGVFVIPNPWDIGTARIFEQLGFRALATTGAGHAFSIGRSDGCTEPEEMLDHVAALAVATSLPLSADVEDGFGASPDTVAATVAAVGARGAVGCSIEDRHYRDEAAGTLFDLGLATGRIRAAVAAARALPFPFTLTARCECFLAGVPDLDETIRRLQAYQDAGADVLYAPGLRTRDEIAAVVSSVDRPVNVVIGLTTPTFSLVELAAIGVRRVSLGSMLSRVAFGAVIRAAEELLATGTCSFVDSAIPFQRINTMFRAHA